MRPWLGPHRRLLQRVAAPILEFFQIEAAGGIVLVGAAALALIWANSPWGEAYERLWTTRISVDLGPLVLAEDLRHWINDGLMVLFFFVVALEIKGEFAEGELRHARRAALPIAAAVGGMVVPGLLYLALNVGGGAPEGWGIAVATDIAFALGVVALLGHRVPHSMKVFLLTLAIADDVGAIGVIALFYTDDLSLPWLGLAIGLLGVVVFLRWLRVWYVPAYVLVGVGVWLATLESGVHATIAGVALGLLTPARPLLSRNEAERLVGERSSDKGSAGDVRETTFLIRESVSVSERLEDILHPWTSYVVIPLFALANAGVRFDLGTIGEAAASPVALGTAVGLVVGKPLGIVASSWILNRFKPGSIPSGVSWLHIAGIGAVAGIGFTMSLFIAGLAFTGGAPEFEQAKLGIFAAAVVAAGAGVTMLLAAARRSKR
ncbi:MAG: Na+/H+ antiporter NhaA [Actinomycetota bacterium]|nr:Na+/H+ antiporter NhaA [Actinomycetota bacterium]